MMSDFMFRAVVPALCNFKKNNSKALGPKNVEAKTTHISGNGSRACFKSSAQDSNEQPGLRTACPSPQPFLFNAHINPRVHPVKMQILGILT